MSTIKVETLTMPAAEIGPSSPLPDLNTIQYIHAGIFLGEQITEEDARYMGYGKISTILPYTIQDGYTRERHPQSFRAIVLENNILRAVFLPELGGRLWSLYHKPNQRELLYVNPVFQPGNLALRNAWFSGGIEWNVGIKGHNPLTCEPLHTEILEKDGFQFLRLYEYERIRCVTYQIEACLPEDSPVLHVKVTIANPQPQTVPMYWWTNIAVPETAGTRIIVPTDEAFHCLYDHGNYTIDRIKIPYTAFGDCSYPVNLPRVMDFFYIIPRERPKWIAAVQPDGIGLAELSSDRLLGRKAFQWGMSGGGRHWQEFLSVPDHPYLEIQSGLARTQLEHLPMGPGECWEFSESLGLIECDPAAIMDADWSKARRAAETGINQLADPQQTDRLFRVWQDISQQPGQIVFNGSGWGALENRRRALCGQPPLSPALAFPEGALDEEQDDWLILLEQGILPEKSPDQPIRSFMVQDDWHDLVRASLDQPGGRHWYSLLVMGLMTYAAGDAASAEKYWQQSIDLQPSAWAYRNLSRLALARGDQAAARSDIETARALLPESRHLVQEYGEVMIQTGQAQQFLDQLAGLRPELAAHPRIAFLKAAALCELNRTTEAKAILDDHFVLPDIREGEISLADLWTKIHQKENGTSEPVPPLPYHLDFRMN